MKTFLRKCLLLIAMLAPVCGLSAEEVTFTAGTDAASASPLTKDNVTISWTGGSPVANFGSNPYSIYQGNKITFSLPSGGGKITQVKINFATGSTGTFTNLKIDNVTLTVNGTTDATWTAASTDEKESVLMTYSSGKKITINSIVVTYTTSGSTDPEKTATTVTFANGDQMFTQGDGDQTFTNVATVKDNEDNVIDGATVTYSSDNENIAIVDNSEVVVRTDNIGTATITATYAGDNTYNGSNATYTITVKKAVITGADNYVKINSELSDYSGKYIIFGKKSDGTHYSLTNYNSGSYIYNCSSDPVTLNGNQVNIEDIKEGVTVFNINKVGEVENKITYSLQNTTTGNYMCTNTKKNTISEADNADGASAQAEIAFSEKGYAITFQEGTYKYFQYNPSSPRFSGYSAANQQPIQLFRHGYSRTVTNEWGTLCLPYGGTISGANLYTIEGKDAETATELYLTKVEKVEAGKPYIIKVTAEDKTFTVYYEGDINTTAANEGSLIGSYNGTNVAEGMYVINGNTVKKCGANSKIGTNRSYIDMSQVNVTTASANATILSFDDTATAIEGIQANADSKSAIYDLSGRRVKATKKGLYIVNGKKVIK